jgi:hypothetical protein
VSHYNCQTPGHVQLRVENKAGGIHLKARPGDSTDVDVSRTGTVGAELAESARVEHRQLPDGSHTVTVWAQALEGCCGLSSEAGVCEGHGRSARGCGHRALDRSWGHVRRGLLWRGKGPSCLG